MNTVTENVILLAESIQKYGFHFERKHTYDHFYIYEKTLKGKFISYECFRRLVKKERMVKGKLIPAHEQFPQHEAFGLWAWDCHTLEDAKARIELYYDNQD